MIHLQEILMFTLGFLVVFGIGIFFKYFDFDEWIKDYYDGP